MKHQVGGERTAYPNSVAVAVAVVAGGGTRPMPRLHRIAIYVLAAMVAQVRATWCGCCLTCMATPSPEPATTSSPPSPFIYTYPSPRQNRSLASSTPRALARRSGRSHPSGQPRGTVTDKDTGKVRDFDMAESHSASRRPNRRKEVAIAATTVVVVAVEVAKVEARARGMAALRRLPPLPIDAALSTTIRS